MKNNDCSVLATANTLEIIAETANYETLARARSFALAAIAELSKTPMVAVGFNIRYSSGDPVDPDFAGLAQCELDTRLAECGLDIGGRITTRSLAFEGGQINVAMAVEEGEAKVDLNFHKASNIPAELSAWLELDDEKIRSITKSIIKNIGIIV